MQLAALQRQTLSKFRAKLGGQKPAADIELTLNALVAETMKAFDGMATNLVPAGSRWTYEYERRSVYEAIDEMVKLHVNTLQVQGLYLSKAGHRMPEDFSAHWLLPHPFGRDSRFAFHLAAC